MIIASASFFHPHTVPSYTRKPSFTLAAVVTYNTILTGLLSAVMVASSLNAIMALPMQQHEHGKVYSPVRSTSNHVCI